MALRKYWKEVLGAIAIFICYFLLRLINLHSLPIFTDEAIYIRWAQIALHDPNWRFISLTDGKQPLFIWAGMIFLKFIKDPLVAVRLVSFFSGLFTLVGIFLLTLELFKKRSIAFVASSLYVFYPFAQVYDRMALYDSMLGALTVWATYFTVLLVRRLRFDLAYTLGFILGGAVLTKSSGIFSAYLLPFALLLRNLRDYRKPRIIITYILLGLFAFAISQAMYASLRLSPFFHIINEKNSIFVYPFSEWIKRPFDFFQGNFIGLSGWILTYLTPSYILLIIIALIFLKKFPKEKIFLLIYFLLPFMALALFGKIIFPRFIYFMSLSLIPIAAAGFDFLFSIISTRFMAKLRTLIFLILLVLFISYPGFVSYTFATDPVNAPIAKGDRDQYISNWPAGWGVAESVSYFKKQAEMGKITIATAGTFGLMPFSYEIYLVENPNIHIESFWPVNDVPPADLMEKAKTMTVYVVFYQPCPSCQNIGDAPITWPVQKVLSIKKSNTNLTIYELINK